MLNNFPYNCLVNSSLKWQFTFDDGSSKNYGNDSLTTMKIAQGKILTMPGRIGKVLYCNEIPCVEFYPTDTALSKCLT